MAPAAARRRGVGGEAALRQGFAKHVTEEEWCSRGEGGTKMHLWSVLATRGRECIYIPL